mmetsp:Transcript_9085/g.23414  ORF Transcript_9085/g.23414 Transcript_9085/m.23414 type:complete len:286 (+) Transcript_9085:272-1129(+)
MYTRPHVGCCGFVVRRLNTPSPPHSVRTTRQGLFAGGEAVCLQPLQRLLLPVLHRLLPAPGGPAALPAALSGPDAPDVPQCGGGLPGVEFHQRRCRHRGRCGQGAAPLASAHPAQRGAAEDRTGGAGEGPGRRASGGACGCGWQRGQLARAVSAGSERHDRAVAGGDGEGDEAPGALQRGGRGARGGDAVRLHDAVPGGAAVHGGTAAAEQRARAAHRRAQAAPRVADAAPAGRRRRYRPAARVPRRLLPHHQHAEPAHQRHLLRHRRRHAERRRRDELPRAAHH